MERLTIDEIIQHCENKTFLYETVGRYIDFETTELTDAIKEYWEHKQVKEYLEKLKRYRDLEEQGLLLRLPCKVGTKVYAINRIIDYGEVGDEATYSYSIIEREFQIYMMMEYGELVFGKTVFLTKEEAEQKLKEMESD